VRVNIKVNSYEYLAGQEIPRLYIRHHNNNHFREIIISIPCAEILIHIKPINTFTIFKICYKLSLYIVSNMSNVV